MSIFNWEKTDCLTTEEWGLKYGMWESYVSKDNETYWFKKQPIKDGWRAFLLFNFETVIGFSMCKMPYYKNKEEAMKAIENEITKQCKAIVMAAKE